MLSGIGVVGCAKSSDTVAVGGKVSYRGEPLVNGAVTFFPAMGRPVSAPTTPEGEYTAQLAPGEYDVVVNVGAELPPGFKEGDPLPPPKIVLPPEYTIRARSTLKATVTAADQEPIDFALE
ncbi:MAG: hypothetical protein L0Y58_24055 [Verrucomicrobia subdivision 3 bacterium]|nr:hypothetical protein [Limisphaerales bacterium]